MKLIYPAIFTKGENSYYVTFPDLIGCQTFGDTVSENYENAKEVLAGYCLSILESGKSLPKATSIEDIIVDDNSFVSFIETTTKIKDKAIKKTLTIPSWLNDLAVENNVNFSQMLQKALIKELQIEV